MASEATGLDSHRTARSKGLFCRGIILSVIRSRPLASRWPSFHRSTEATSPGALPSTAPRLGSAPATSAHAGNDTNTINSSAATSPELTMQTS